MRRAPTNASRADDAGGLARLLHRDVELRATGGQVVRGNLRELTPDGWAVLERHSGGGVALVRVDGLVSAIDEQRLVPRHERVEPDVENEEES